QRPLGMIGHQAIVLETKGAGLARPHQRVELAAAGPDAAGHPLDGPLEAFDQGHGGIAFPDSNDNRVGAVAVPSLRGRQESAGGSSLSRQRQISADDRAIELCYAALPVRSPGAPR